MPDVLFLRLRLHLFHSCFRAGSGRSQRVLGGGCGGTAIGRQRYEKISGPGPMGPEGRRPEGMGLEEMGLEGMGAEGRRLARRKPTFSNTRASVSRE